MAGDAPAVTQLIPSRELSPGAVTAIRNQVINFLVATVARELNLLPNKLVVRDARPLGDLQLYSTASVDTTSERWGYAASGTTIGYQAVSGATKTMGDQRWCAIYGIRDRGAPGNIASGSATVPVARTMAKPVVSLVKVNVGGSDKVIWDITGMYGYTEDFAAFSPSAVIIPQNANYQISFYRTGSLEIGTTTAPVDSEISWLQLVAVVCEPRGKVISP